MNVAVGGTSRPQISQQGLNKLHTSTSLWLLEHFKKVLDTEYEDKASVELVNFAFEEDSKFFFLMHP
jgi:hypothetical protein